MTRLVGARAKLRRAEEHLVAVHNDITTWIDSNPYTTPVESNPEGTEHRFVLRVHRPPNVDGWACLIGDCVHNLRSALDHLAWEVTKPSNRNTRTEFPIFADDIIDANGKVVPNYQSKVQGISNNRVRDFIDGRQPCNTPPPKETPLWAIHRLDIVDKHKTMVPVLFENASNSILGQMSLLFAEDAVAMGPPSEFIHNPDPVGDGDTLLSFTTVGRVEDIKADFSFPLRVAIDLRDPDLDIVANDRLGKTVKATLTELRKAVSTIIGKVEKLT